MRSSPTRAAGLLLVSMLPNFIYSMMEEQSCFFLRQLLISADIQVIFPLSTMRQNRREHDPGSQAEPSVTHEFSKFFFERWSASL